MEAMLARGEAFDLRHYSDVSAGLDERHHAANIVTFGRAEHGDGLCNFRPPNVEPPPKAGL